MMKRWMLILLVILLGSSPALAQQCQREGTCGIVPWQMPNFPVLRSPTPFPTQVATQQLTPTATATRTNTPGPTPTPATPSPTMTATQVVNMDGIYEQLGTIQAISNATPVYIDNDENAPNFAANTLMFFGYVRGVQQLTFGPFTPLISFFFFAFFFYVGVNAFFILLPVITAVVGLIRRLVSFILDFIPG